MQKNDYLCAQFIVDTMKKDVVERVMGGAIALLFCVFQVGCRPHNTPQYTDAQRLMLDTTNNHVANYDSLRSVVQKYQAEGNKEMLMAAYAELGHSFQTASQYMNAVDAHLQELALAQELKDSLMMATCLNDLGVNYRRMSLYKEALRYHSQAIEVASTPKETDLDKYLKCQAVGNNGIGNIYIKVGNYEQAEHYLRLALAIETRLGSHLGMNVDNSNIGMTYEHRGMYDSAQVYFERSMQHSILCDSKTGIAYSHMNFGRVYQHYGEYDKAVVEFEEAMQVINKDRDQWLWLQPCIATAGIYVTINNQEKAEEYLEMALETAKRLNSKEHFVEIYNLYSTYYEKQGQPTKALQYANMSREANDSLLGQQTIFDLNNLHLNLAREESDRRLSETRLQVATERMWKYIIGFGLVICLLLAFIYWLVAHYRLKVNQSQKAFIQIRERFFTNITHEFRTPLTIILGKADELLQKPDAGSENVTDAGKLIQSNGRHMLNLVNQLLDISKVQTTIGDAQWRSGNVVPFLHMLMEECQQLAKQKDISLQYAASKADIQLDMVPEYLQKILINLISNAIKFTPEKGKVYITAQETDGNFQLQVADTGIGIAPENLKQIFEPFYQEGRDTQNIGTGVGLSLVNELTHAMDGTIKVDSQVGQGTVFTLLLPLQHGKGGWPAFDTVQVPAAALPLQNIDTENTQEKLQDAEADTRKTKILIVEDNADIAYHIGSQLGKQYALYYALNGEEGLKKAGELLPGIIITDLMMPGMSGLELCKKVRSNQQTNTIPVIIITAMTRQEDVEEGLRAGANAYLFKPFSGNELRIRVNWLLTERKMLQEKYMLAAQQVDGLKQTLSKEDQELISKFTNLVYDQMRDIDINLDVLAMEMCMSKSTLRRRMTELTGDTLTNYITKIRVDYAQQLLKRNPEYSIAEVGLRCGFSDQAYFSRVFKQAVGVSPAQYRKNLEVKQ